MFHIHVCECNDQKSKNDTLFCNSRDPMCFQILRRTYIRGKGKTGTSRLVEKRKREKNGVDGGRISRVCGMEVGGVSADGCQKISCKVSGNLLETSLRFPGIVGLYSNNKVMLHDKIKFRHTVFTTMILRSCLIRLLNI